MPIDILVLGATGFTGRLITRYLYSHPSKSTFTFALAARSKSKLSALASSLNLDASVPLKIVDVSKQEELDEAIKGGVKVVINTVGPYWLWGTPVVRACVMYGVHYVDLTGETHWIRDIINEFDYAATKTHAIIIPSCGTDSIPSDLTTFLSALTLRRLSPTSQAALSASWVDVNAIANTSLTNVNVNIDQSTTAFQMKGGFSGGTLATAITILEEVPSEKMAEARADYCLCAIKGLPLPPPKPVYTLPFVTPQMVGGFYPMAPVNKAVVQRTWSLLEDARGAQNRDTTAAASYPISYGPQFKYLEFVAMPNKWIAMLWSLSFALGWMSLSFFPPLRWLFKKIIPPPGSGPSDEVMEAGFLKVTNTTSTTATPPVVVKSTLNGRGDAGYLLTSIMISESALALLDTSSLSPLARQGGVLTPMSALGEALIKRLEANGRFRFESEILRVGVDADTGIGGESRKRV